MFKYFTLLFDYFLAICYLRSIQHFKIMIILPPIFHTLTFLITPHCYNGHCKLKCKYRLVKQIDQKKDHNKTHDIQPNHHINNLTGIGQYLTPYKQDSNSMQQQASPSPQPFSLSISDTIKQTHHEQNQQSIKKKLNQNDQWFFQCKQCGLIKWIRMQHCYYCKICVHKYDHHCILLGICIGQANQKYYLPFLWTFLYSSIVQLIDYYSMMSNYIWVDQNGYQHMQIQYIGMGFGIIFFIASIGVVTYLAITHVQLAFLNQTTYQKRKRQQSKYLSGIKQKYPFNKGILSNIMLILMADRNNPIEWQRPRNPQTEQYELTKLQSNPQNSQRKKTQDILTQFDKNIQTGKLRSQNLFPQSPPKKSKKVDHNQIK